METPLIDWTRLPRLVWRPWMSGALVFLCVAVALVAHARDYLPFFADDGFISLRYAERLLEGRGLTWNDGERVEGYSNLSWVLGCALLGMLGLDLVEGARLLGQVSGVAAVAALVVCHRPRTGALREALPSLASGLMVALSGSFAVWAVGGLEQPLFAACLAWGTCLVTIGVGSPARGSRLWILSSLPFALLCWTRPDGPLLVVLVGLGLILAMKRDRETLRRAGLLLTIPAVFVVAQLAFRLLYYSAWIPNSGTAKLAFTAERVFQGLRYITEAAVPFRALIILAATSLLPLLFDSAARRRIVVFIPAALGWTLYVVVIGGDIFPARRHLVPLVVLAGFAAAEGLRWLIQRGPRVRWWTYVGVVAALAMHGAAQLSDTENRRARDERWEWDGRVMGELFRRQFGEAGALVAVDSAGSLPYYSKLPTIDMLGINDAVIARSRPGDFGRGALGHELGDGGYVLSREPDLVVFGLPAGERNALYRSGQEMQHAAAFARGYSMVTFEAPGPEALSSQVWVRNESARLGFVRMPERIVVPGLFLARGAAPAREDGEGRLGVTCGHDAPAAGRIRLVPPGTWRLSASWAGMEPESSLRVGRQQTLEGSLPIEFAVCEEASDVDLGLRPRGAGISHVVEVVLDRVAGCP